MLAQATAFTDISNNLIQNFSYTGDASAGQCQDASHDRVQESRWDGPGATLPPPTLATQSAKTASLSSAKACSATWGGAVL